MPCSIAGKPLLLWSLFMLDYFGNSVMAEAAHIAVYTDSPEYNYCSVVVLPLCYSTSEVFLLIQICCTCNVM